jgi:hypothetical protein
VFREAYLSSGFSSRKISVNCVAEPKMRRLECHFDSREGDLAQRTTPMIFSGVILESQFER